MKSRYVPDIRTFGAICEGNYVRLLKLFPGIAAGCDEQVDLVGGEGFFLGRVQATVMSTSRYTQEVLLRQILSSGPWLNDPQMRVRLYHDALMVEVISAAQHQRLDAVYDYPNHHMHLPDEKQQVNRFLADWLQYCLRHLA